MKRRDFLIFLGGLLTACDAVNREPDYTVVIGREHKFEPASLSIPRGSIVAWHHRADSVHTVTADPEKAQLPERILLPSGVTPFDSGDLYSGERWVYTFETPGMYVYFCRYHEMEEMFGTITVNG